MELSQQTKKLIQRYQAWSRSLQPREGVSFIHVDEIASGLASFYEKIREIIEWQEEHLLRKSAIERVLRRRLILKKDGKKIAGPLVLELIRAGHFPNDKIPESKILKIQKIIQKYIFILERSSPFIKDQQRADFFNWILQVAACEIEATLSPPLREEGLIDYMTEIMKERIKINEGIGVEAPGEISEEEKNAQIYIACQRALFKLDDPLISYHLLKKQYPNWEELSFSPELEEIAKNIQQIREDLRKRLKHPWAEKFYKVCERYNTPYLILGDIIGKNPSDAENQLKNPEILEDLIKKTYQERYIKLKEKLKRAAIYSTISILIARIILCFFIEFPLGIYFNDQFNYFTLTINLITPPLLMFFSVATIGSPRKENFQRVLMEVMKIVYKRERKEIYEVKKPLKRGVLLKTIIAFFYLLGFLVSFGIIILGLQKLNFRIFSIAIFLVFLCPISFAGAKIRQRAKELEIREEKETSLSIIFDFFALPILQVGKLLSNWWKKHNFLAVLFSFLFDLPFQMFVEFLEQWRCFLKEKRDEIH